MFEITITVPDERIAYVLCTAWEGGSNYWVAGSEGSPLRDGHLCPECGGFARNESRPAERDHEWLFACPNGHEFTKPGTLSLKLPVKLHVIDDDPVVLDRAGIERGVSLLAGYPHILAEILEGERTPNTGDVFLQLCVFGEVRYG